MIRYCGRTLGTRATLAAYFSTKTVGNIDFHEFDSFTKVVLNRPKALNSLNVDMIRTLRNEIPNLDKTKAVWFEGAGGKSFCAGGDVKDLFSKEATVEDRLTFFRE
jgi:enoyl-CoA hydratase/carnithine racemase